MTAIIATCRRCAVEFEPDRRAVVSGAWRLCPACQDVGTAADVLPIVGEISNGRPAVCPICRRVLKSGTHRGACPGRRRRR